MNDDYLSKIKQINELIDCSSLQEMLDGAFAIFGNPTLAHSMEYKLLSYAKNVVTDDPIWNEFIKDGTVSQERIDFYKKEGFLDAVASTNSSTMLISSNLPYDRIFSKLFINDTIQIGCMCMVACYSPFKSYDFELFERFRQLVGKKLSGKEDFVFYGYEYQKWLIRTLIEGTYGNKELFSPHIANLYEGLSESIYIAVVDISECKNFHSPDDYIHHLRTINDKFKYFVYDNYIIVILSGENKRAENCALNKSIYKPLFANDNVYVGKSECFDNLFEIQKYFLKAKDALIKGKALGGQERVFE